jgi:hypothetical protein
MCRYSASRGLSAEVLCARSVRRGRVQIGSYGAARSLSRSRSTTGMNASRSRTVK